MAIQDGRFRAVASANEVMRLLIARAEVVDLGGRTVLRGLNDSHMHSIRAGLNYTMELRWEGVLSGLIGTVQRLNWQFGKALGEESDSLQVPGCTRHPVRPEEKI